MWSVENAQSDQTINYFVLPEQWKIKWLDEQNVIQVMELLFMPIEARSNENKFPFSFVVVIFKDAQQVLTEKEIISEVSQYKAPGAEYIDSKVLFIR